MCHRFMLGVVLAACLMVGCRGQDNHSAIITTPVGQVAGVIENGLWVFKGIPYAAPPVGELRWRPTQAVIPWQGILDTKTFASDCMQEPFPGDAAPLTTEPSEDCLYLNIWRKAEPLSGALPVLVWIHGGGFVNGGASPKVYDGSAFAQQDILFVSINYRLGRFGFFAHPALSAAGEGGLLGNYAYMDQIAALTWVKNNIARFGGNPDDVTVMGESAGGFSVLNLMLAKQAKGLFHKAIVMSGGGRKRMGGMRAVSFDYDGVKSGEEVGERFAQAHGIASQDGNALEKLRKLSPEQVTGGLNLAKLFSPPPGPETFVGGPMLDGQMITGAQMQQILAGDFTPVPVLIGTTSQDIGYLGAASKSALFEQFDEYAEAMRLAYDPSDSLSLEALSALIGADLEMHEPAHFIAREVTKRGQPAWVYRFSYVAESMQNVWSGAPHATEIPFFFNTAKAHYGGELTASDAHVAEMALQAFSNFVKTKNPNFVGRKDWLSYQGAHGPIMDFERSGEAVVKSDPWQTRLSLLTQFMDKK